MPVYKSRVDNIGSIPKPKKKRKRKGGSVKRLPKTFTTKQAINFVKNNPQKAINIAKDITNPKGGGSGKTLLGTSLGVLGGVGIGALGFRQYLLNNPTEAIKLAGKGAIGLGKIFLKGSGLSTGGSIPISDESREESQSFPKGGSFKNIIKQFQSSHVDNFHPLHMIHSVQHMTPHEFGLCRGIASNFLKIPHPMDGHLKRHLDNFKIPKGISKVALRDIIKAKSPHHLAEALHSEFLDMKKGMKVGGGLFDSMKSVFKKGLSGSKRLTSGIVNVSKSFDNIMKRGLLIAEAIEPLVEIIDPDLGRAFSSAVKTARAIKTGAKVVGTSAKVINKTLHGDIDGTIDALSKLPLKEGTQQTISKSGKLLKEIQKGVEKASDVINIDDPKEERIDTEKLQELTSNLDLLDEANV